MSSGFSFFSSNGINANAVPAMLPVITHEYMCLSGAWCYLMMKFWRMMKSCYLYCCSCCYFYVTGTSRHGTKIRHSHVIYRTQTVADHEAPMSVKITTDEEINLLCPIIAPDLSIKLFKSAEAKLVKSWSQMLCLIVQFQGSWILP